MKTPSISIIVPTYNQEKWIGRCLRSLLNQIMERDAYEIIVVDDGSTDKTLDVAEEIKSTIDPDVQIIINKKNIGPSGSIKNFINQMNEGKLFVISGDNDLDKFLIKNLILGSLQADFVLSYYLNREEKGWLRANISTLFNLILCTFFRVYAFYLQGPVVWPIKIVKDL